MRRLFQLLLLSLCSYPQCPAEGAQAYETSPAWVGNDAHIESQRFAPHQRYELIPYYYLAHLAYDAGELKAGVQDLQCRRHLSGWMPSLPVRRAVIGAPAEAYPLPRAALGQMRISSAIPAAHWGSASAPRTRRTVLDTDVHAQSHRCRRAAACPMLIGELTENNSRATM